MGQRAKREGGGRERGGEGLREGKTKSNFSALVFVLMKLCFYNRTPPYLDTNLIQSS